MLNNKKRRRELGFLISLLTLCLSVQAQKRPPNYSQDDMPITSFSCDNRIVGGYYADPETDCQMFHVCANAPGVGIQDFRFLCPNDTTFDQEHQICDDWYNIDCELALYGGFDLYRIGVDNEIKKPSIPKKPIVANKGTPIPLGPSSTVKPFIVAAPKKNVYTAVNNGISEDDDYYKRNGNSVSDESKVPNDILRGSHSSNFYDSKTRGREDFEDDYVAPNTGAKRQEVNPTPDVKKHKTLVRKLASKRPVSQKPVQQNYNAVNYNAPQPVQPQRNQTDFAARTSQTKYRGNVNFNTATRIQQQQDIDDFQKIPVTNSPNLYQKINNLTEDANSQEKKQDTSRNYENAYSFRSQSKFRPTSKPTSAAPVTTADVRLPSTQYLQNIANNYQQPATLINNQLQDSAEYRNNAYNNQAYDYTFQQFKQPTSNQSPSTKFQTVPQKYYETSTSLPEQKKSTEFQNFYQPNTTVFDYYKYYQTSTTSYQQKAKNYYATTTTTASPKYDPYATFQKSNEKYEEDEFLKTAPSSNLKPSDLNTIYNQKKANNVINATLKATYSIEPHKASYYQAKASAAPGTSQINYYQSPSTSTQNYYQPPSTSTQTNYYQAAVTSAPQTNYYQQPVNSSPQNHYQSAATNAPAQNYYQSVATNAPAQNFYQSVATNAPAQNYYQPAVTNAPAQNNYYQSSTTKVPQNTYYQSVATNAPQKSNYYQPAPTSTPKSAPVKQTSYTAAAPKSPTTNNVSQKPTDQKSSRDYDYAYYDNVGGSSEYDGFENVGEDFAKIKNTKHA